MSENGIHKVIMGWSIVLVVEDSFLSDGSRKAIQSVIDEAIEEETRRIMSGGKPELVDLLNLVMDINLSAAVANALPESWEALAHLTRAAVDGFRKGIEDYRSIEYIKKIKFPSDFDPHFTPMNFAGTYSPPHRRHWSFRPR